MKLVAFNAFDMRTDLDLLITRSDSPVLIEATDSAVRFRYPDESENLFGGTILYDTSPPQEPNDVFIGESYFSLFKQFNSQKVLFYSIANLDLAGATYDSYLDSYDGGDIDSSRKLSQFILREKDTIIGSPGADYLLGYEGDDEIKGDSGNDTLDGGTGADSMNGGLGNDIYVVDSTGDVVTEGRNAGTDNVQSSITYTLGANLENLILTGSAAIDGTGNTLNNTITGNTAANTLNGGVGADTMAGGLGNDIYVVDNSRDLVVEVENQGTDTIQSSITYQLGVNIENLILTGTKNINGTGNSAANTLTGNSANNILDGAEGTDIMIGGLGNDTYVVDNASDVTTELASEGTDTVQSSVTHTLGANLENLILNGTSSINGIGNDLDNTITGNSNNSTLNGGAGNDSLIGNKGDDTLIGGLGNDVLKGGEGNDIYYVDSIGDTIADTKGTDQVISSINWNLGSNLENLTLTETDALTGIGNTLNNIIVGNSGNNVLDGLGGTDILTGGLGADVFRFSTKPKFGASTADHITDFKGSEGDGLEISASLLGLTMGPTVRIGLSVTTVNSASALTTALGSTTTFVYDTSNGNLYWNQNGNKSGFGSGGIFAVLDNKTALNSSNFSLF